MALAILTANTFAQDASERVSATLIHGNETTNYYGETAFKNAYTAAADSGDVIVLSPGTFGGNNSDYYVYITKSISIYGSGMRTDTISGRKTTTVPKIQINRYTSYDEYGKKVMKFPTIYLEGLCIDDLSIHSVHSDDMDADVTYLPLTNALFRKCWIKDLKIAASTQSCRVQQCRLSNISSYIYKNGKTETYQNFNWPQKQLNFENCYTESAIGGSVYNCTVTYDHCIIRTYNYYSSYISGWSYSNLTNNIIYSSVENTCTAYNNIFTVSDIGTTNAENNWTGIANAGIWADPNEDGSYGDYKDYKLKFPETYVGTDGTEVGINGGIAPFDRTSAVPRLLSSQIDLRTSDDGKLNVKIQVEAQTHE